MVNMNVDDNLEPTIITLTCFLCNNQNIPLKNKVIRKVNYYDEPH